MRVHINDVVSFSGYACPVEQGPLKKGQELTVIGICGTHDNPQYLVQELHSGLKETLVSGEFVVLRREKNSTPLKIRKPRNKKDSAMEQPQKIVRRLPSLATTAITEPSSAVSLPEPTPVALEGDVDTTPSLADTYLRYNDLTVAMRELIQREQQNDVAMACVLYYLRQRGAHTEEGEHKSSDFAKYVTSAFGIARRKVFYLLSVYEMAVAMGVSHARMENIGWTKLAILASCFSKNPEAAHDLFLTLENNKTLTVEELKGLVSDRVQIGEGQTVSRTMFKFVLYESKADTVNRVINEMKGMVSLGPDADEDTRTSEALFLLASTYEELSGGLSAALTLEQEIEQLELKWGVTLNVNRPADAQIAAA